MMVQIHIIFFIITKLNIVNNYTLLKDGLTKSSKGTLYFVIYIP